MHARMHIPAYEHIPLGLSNICILLGASNSAYNVWKQKYKEIFSNLLGLLHAE